MKMQIFKFIKSSKYYVLGGGAVVLFFFAVQQAAGFPIGDPDGYYHAKVAQLIYQHLLSTNFPWLAFTTWSSGYADQHYLYHLLLYPFSTIKLLPYSVILFSSLATFSFIWLLKYLKVRQIWLWVVFFLIGSADFLFRINLVKANALSLILLFASIIAIDKKKFWVLFALSFIFVWAYGGFVFLPAVVGAYCLLESLDKRKVIIRPLLFSIVGIILGIIFHPQFPNIVIQLYNQIFQAGLGSGGVVSVGREWEPYQLSNFLQTNVYVFVLWLFGFALFLQRLWKKTNLVTNATTELWLLILSLFFFALALKSRRFAEYWVPFAILFSAYSLSTYLEKLSWADLKKQTFAYWQVQASAGILFLAILAMAWQNVSLVNNYLKQANSTTAYKGVSKWLLQNSRPGEIVFNTKWDQTPQLFFYNSKNYYIVGLDPTFMYLEDHKLYFEWNKISDDNIAGLSSAELYRDVKFDFKSSFVFVENKRNPNIKIILDNSNHFLKVYGDSLVSLYKLN